MSGPWWCQRKMTKSKKKASKKTENPPRATHQLESKCKVLQPSLREIDGNMRNVQSLSYLPHTASLSVSPNFVQVSDGDPLTPAFHSALTNVTQGHLLGEVFSDLMKKRHLKRNCLFSCCPLPPAFKYGVRMSCLELWQLFCDHKGKENHKEANPET